MVVGDLGKERTGSAQKSSPVEIENVDGRDKADPRGPKRVEGSSKNAKVEGDKRTRKRWTKTDTNSASLSSALTRQKQCKNPHSH